MLHLPGQNREGTGETGSPGRRGGHNLEVNRGPPERPSRLPDQADGPLDRGHRQSSRDAGSAAGRFTEIKVIVAAHVRAVLADQLVDVRSSDPEAVTRWLADKITYPVPAGNLTAPGFSLQGARIEYLLDRPAAAIVYSRRDHAITLLARPNETSGSLAMRGQRNGYHVLAWTNEQLAYVAVSDLPARELDRLEEALRAPEPVLRTGADSTVG